MEQLQEVFGRLQNGDGPVAAKELSRFVTVPLRKRFHALALEKTELGSTAENKTKPTKVSVAAFIDAVTDQTKRADAKFLVKLMQSATGEKPKMWGPSIIGFGSCHYKYASGREGDMPLIGFSPHKAATVLYVTTAFSGSEELLTKLSKYTRSKSCLYIKKLTDVDRGALETLIAKSVAATRAAYSCTSCR